MQVPSGGDAGIASSPDGQSKSDMGTAKAAALAAVAAGGGSGGDASVTKLMNRASSFLALADIFRKLEGF